MSYARPWNARPEAKRLARDVPKAQLWAHDPRGISQVGCIYTAQGFEFDYVGVIFGRDLKYDFDKGTWEGHKEHSHDTVVKDLAISSSIWQKTRTGYCLPED